MTRSAAPITRRILEAIERLDDLDVSVAEVARRVNADIERHGLTRPSYECLRTLIRESRLLRARVGPSALRIYLESTAAGTGPSRYALEQMLLPRDERSWPTK